MNPDDCCHDYEGGNYEPPALDAKDTELLKDMLTTARHLNINGYGSHGQSAMAALITATLGLGDEYSDVTFRAIGGAEFRVSVTGEVTI